MMKPMLGSTRQSSMPTWVQDDPGAWAEAGAASTAMVASAARVEQVLSMDIPSSRNWRVP
ncbi:hypothetical protein [Rhodoplanes elegans]|uniref:hypothetical protein n=1 Tax=Rhodoplanes elegans TaxID=29408 RepID=UPI001FE05312|nr:hypothetical protein [Rhodoplanes elegans]